jgi:hypothetical protein
MGRSSVTTVVRLGVVLIIKKPPGQRWLHDAMLKYKSAKWVALFALVVGLALGIVEFVARLLRG